MLLGFFLVALNSIDKQLEQRFDLLSVFAVVCLLYLLKDGGKLELNQDHADLVGVVGWKVMSI